MFKTLFRVKPLIFWTFAFPIILGAFFNMAFSNIEKAETFDVIDIAVVDSENFQKDVYMKETLSVLGDKNSDDRLFNIKYVTEENAKKLLEDDDIVGYLIYGSDGGNKIIISQNGTSQTIFKSAVEEIIQTSDIVQKNMMKSAPDMFTGLVPDDQAAMNELMTAAMETVDKISAKQNVNLKNVSRKNLSYTMIEFYTLIAMTCLYGGIIGMSVINQNLANMSCNGRRVAMSPAKKGNVVLSSLLAGYAVQLIGIALLFFYTAFILKVDYGENLPLIVLMALAGCFAGLSLGIAVGVLFKFGEGAKIGVILAISMLGCFLSGMMGITLKYYIDKDAPIVNKMNPAAMITDGFYSLYYYDTYERYIFSIAGLMIFSAIMLALSWSGLRRQQYDSI